jgi:hypothetical protein
LVILTLVVIGGLGGYYLFSGIAGEKASYCWSLSTWKEVASINTCLMAINHLSLGLKDSQY